MAYHSNKIHAPELIYLPGGLKVGTQIIVRGKVPYGSSGFSLNLKYGDDSESDIAFHFNPRTTQNEVIRNSFAGDWQDEEKHQPDFPFWEGRTFQLRIYVTPDEYKVMVNGQDFIDYNHRMPFEQVRFLELNEEAEYHDVTIQNSMGTPYYGEFRSGLQVGNAIRVRGATNMDANNFGIYFNCDCDGETTGFVFNPRQSEEEVVRNAKFGDWGDEERSQPDFPFTPGDFFDILFIATEGRFNVYVNEKFFTSFDYRCDVEDMKYLAITGDVTLADVQFFEPLPDDFKKKIPSGLEKGDMIIVKGFFFPEGNRFQVNLINGDSLEDDVAFVINPRRDQGEVVMNNRVDGEWQAEEREELPGAFQEMLPFELKIVTKKSKFKIYVNGKKFSSFHSRSSVEDIKTINVSGEAYIYRVKLQRVLEKPYVERIPGGLQVGGWIIVQGTAKKHAESFAINLHLFVVVLPLTSHFFVVYLPLTSAFLV
ncbi:32 kDa beta-galactoside-binding lectin-like isoform X2 [Gigantopelta aegis]|uniref:32 kDa beta-galactoside-binding lectin-like isoform X2 n=1 Tax=Gigantopelta aegis TaxID=1735272 RepID=UPI001B88E6D5|nr:32 kDa beta-galactoside-binding lectin-like isoform X2 [Gigantopelta aegis]